MTIARINSIDLYYEDRGRGFPVVFVPGFTGTATLWRRQTGPFAQRYRVVTFDPRGHGRSDAPDDPRLYTAEAFVDDIAALLDHLGVERAHVAGHSMGGAVAMRFALTYPQRIGALVVLNSNSAAAPPGWGEMVLSRMRGAAEAMRTEGIGVMAAGMINRRLPPSDLAEREREFAALSPIGIGHTATGALPYLSSLDRAHELRCPTLLVAGELDRDFMERSLWLQERVANSERVMIAGGGHCANEDRPGDFNAAVLDFLARVDGVR